MAIVASPFSSPALIASLNTHLSVHFWICVLVGATGHMRNLLALFFFFKKRYSGLFYIPDGLALLGLFSSVSPFPSSFEFLLVSLKRERDICLFPIPFVRIVHGSCTNLPANID